MKLVKMAALLISCSFANLAFSEGAESPTAKPVDAQKVNPPESKEANATNPESKSATKSPDYTCSMDNAKRTVRVTYEKEGSKVPCKVNYLRDAATGEEKILYNAATEEGYCEKKAGEFVEKLKSSGWSCTNP